MAVKSKKSSVKDTKKESPLGGKSSVKGSVGKGVSKKEPENMADLLASYGKEVKGLKRGDKIKGKVISKTSKKLYLDIDRKSEGLVAEKLSMKSGILSGNLRSVMRLLLPLSFPRHRRGIPFFP